MDVSERYFEESIERALLAGGPDALPSHDADGAAGIVAERR